MNDLHERINELERAQRRWKRLACASLGILVLIASVVAMSASTSTAQAQEAKPDAQSGKAQPAYYANFCHITFLHEELVLDFALNTNLKDPPKGTIPGSNRVVINYYTAKRLRDGLQTVVKKYEDAFGPLELDLEKRAKGGKIH